MAQQAVLTHPAAAHESHARRRGGPRLYHFAIEHLLALPLGAVLALAWVNAAPESYYRFTYSIGFLVNDVAMALFFGLLTKEVVEATAPGGVLHSWRKVALPMVAATGAVILPAAAYAAYVRYVDEPMLEIGWLVPGAIDLAIAYFVARLIFRDRSAIPFLLVMGIAATGLGFAALASLHPVRDAHWLDATALMTSSIAISVFLRRRRVPSFWPYMVLSGTLSWLAFYRAGVHPALALVTVVPFLPHAARDPGFFVDARPGAHDALSRFELWWQHPAQVALFFFALINAGVRPIGLESGTWAVPIAALLAKPAGILLATGLGIAAGLHLPNRVGWKDLVVIACVASTGFTMALFFTSAIMAPGQFLSETRMGVLLGLAGVPLAFAVARLLRIGRYQRYQKV